MPSASRNAKRKRRMKRNLTLMSRLARTEQLDRTKVTVVLLAILARHGGEVEILQENLDTIVNSLGHVQYVVAKKNPDVEPFDGQFVVRLVTDSKVEDATETVQV